jgi:predicted amidophosphoribosyltransferase
VGDYQGALRKAIVSYKYRRDLRWARTFGMLLHGFLRRHPTWFEEYGVVCPVPAYPGPGAHRSWGHVELVCAELAWSAGAEWPVESLVAKVAETEPMSAKAGPARRQIARQLASGTFVVPVPAEVAGRRVLVVDDVCVSGGTLLSVGGALVRAGAAEVSALVLARARWHP